MMPDFKMKTCCFTGHRDIAPGDVPKILGRVREILEPLIQNGVSFFGVGGAVGFDMIAAEYLIDLRDNHEKSIKIISVLPFPDWRSKWTAEQFARQETIMKKSDKTVFVQREYSKDVYLARDRKLVDESGFCISYCNRKIGGTAYTVRYAMKKGLCVYNASSWDINQL